MNSIFSGVTIATAPDAHSFADLATKHTWLQTLKQRASNARIESFDDLHLALFYVHTVTAAYLAPPDCIIADGHICKLLDDQAELCWTEVAE